MQRDSSVQDEVADRPPKWSLRRFALVRARLLFGLTAFVAFLGLFAPWSTFAEITTHFRVYYTVAALAAVVLAVVSRQRALVGLTAALLVFELMGIVPWYTRTSTQSGPSGIPLKVLSSNVELDNTQFGKLRDLVQSENPDIILLQEVNARWLDTLRGDYPHYVEVRHPGHFGLALYSRYPLDNVQQDDPTGNDVPILRADANINGTVVHIVNLHIPNPGVRPLLRVRTAQFAWLAEHSSAIEGPAIVAGDFNSTMWSPLYKTVVESGGLTNAREGHGILSTWMPLLGSLHLLPLDHVLVSGLSVTNARLGGGIGSDHSPFIAELNLPQN